MIVDLSLNVTGSQLVAQLLPMVRRTGEMSWSLKETDLCFSRP